MRFFSLSAASLFCSVAESFWAVLALLTFCSIFDEFCRIWSAVPIVFERVGFWVLFFSGVGRRAALCRTVVFFCRSLVRYIVFCSSCRFDRLLGVHFQIWWASGCLSAGEFMGVHSNFPLSCCMHWDRFRLVFTGSLGGGELVAFCHSSDSQPVCSAFF